MLAVRFLVQDRGGGPSLWDRITSPARSGVPLDGDPALHQLLAGRRLQSASAVSATGAACDDGEDGGGGGAGKEWEWGLFSGEDRARFVALGPYMNAAVHAVTESCPLSRAYRLFRRCPHSHARTRARPARARRSGSGNR